MTGEKQARYRSPPRPPDERDLALPQPGGRSPAPGSLALLQGFVNTRFDLGETFGADLLGTPVELSAWLRSTGLTSRRERLGGPELEAALELREGLRALARAGIGDGEASRRARERLDALAGEARVELHFGAEGPELRGAPRAGFAGASGALLAIAAAAIADGSWSRLKVCPGHHCGWLFYDHSRNRSGRWCSMAVCGGREKARTHYRRRQEA